MDKPIISGYDTAIQALVGSCNYHMDIKDSDKDYKYFVWPGWDDIYSGNYINKTCISNNIDYTIQDIRKLPKFLFKSNINFLEVLFSSEAWCAPELQWLYDKREDIARINLNYLKNSCIGMSIEKYKRLHKYNDNTQWMEKEFGYNTKEAYHALRAVDTFVRYHNTEFTSFNNAFSYNDGSAKLFIDIRNGIYNEEEVSYLINTTRQKAFNIDISCYKNNILLYDSIYISIKDIIYKKIKE